MKLPIAPCLRSLVAKRRAGIPEALLLVMQQAGWLDHKRTVSSMSLFAKEVYPQIMDLPRTQPLSMKAAAE